MALLLLSGLLGAFLARRQGLGVLRKVRSETAAGRLPTGQLVDGALILLAGILLILPGVVTDALGFFCLLPAGRTLLKAWLRRRFEAGLRSGRIAVSVGTVSLDGMRNITPRQHDQIGWHPLSPPTASPSQLSFKATLYRTRLF